MARPCGLPGKSICRDVCNGRHICRPYNQPIIFIIIYGRGRGMPRPYRAMIYIAPRRNFSVTVKKMSKTLALCGGFAYNRTMP